MTDGFKLFKSSRLSCKDIAEPPILIPSSESSCSDEEITPQKTDRTLSSSEGKTPRKIFPIFVRTLQNNKSNLSSERQPYQTAEGARAAAFSNQKKNDPLAVSPHLTGKDGRGLSTCGEQLPDSELQGSLDEIQTSNPSFPVHTVFSALQKKARDGLQKSKAGHASHKSPPSKKKRKEEIEGSGRLMKRPRCCVSAEAAMDPDLHSFSAQKKPRGSKLSLSRTRRLKQQRGRPAVHHQCHSGPELHQGGSCVEDTLWTDKYSPQHSSEVIGNAASVAKLHSWLKKWKLRANQDERRKMEERRRDDDSWDCGDFQGESASEDPDEEFLWNTVLISGPPGVGKTASVYACSQELGFKVFEVNCSSQRSGRLLLSQLKEATQSHLVEISGADRLKPVVFSSIQRSEAGKTSLPKNVTSASKKAARRKLSSRRHKAPADALTLAHFFKVKREADGSRLGGTPPSGSPDRKLLCHSFAGRDQSEPRSKSAATSLILFEEVDVIFEDDVGFLGAIKAFTKTTKRPVVLTTNDPLFKDRFDSSLEEIVFKAPSEGSVGSYLQLVSLAENRRLDSGDARNLAALTGADVRRCLLQLQLWLRSGGGGAQTGGLTKQLLPPKKCRSELPPCETSCSASMLGLQSSEPDTKVFLNLLAESWRGGVPLLYSNLELLLSSGASVLGPDEETGSCLHADLRQQKRNITCRTSASRLSRRRGSAAATNPRLIKSWMPRDSGLNGNREEKAADSTAALADFFDLMSYLDSTFPDAGRPVSGSSRSTAFVWTGAALADGSLDETGEEERLGDGEEGLLDIRAAAEGLGFGICSRSVTEAWILPHTEEWESERSGTTTLPKTQTLILTSQPLCAPSLAQRRLKLSRKVLSSRTFGLLGNRRAVCAEYLPVLRFICHKRKEQASFMLDLSKSTVQLLAKDFIWRSLEKPLNRTSSSLMNSCPPALHQLM
ncbi:ATPase family AAA domain-containing protein 5 isoform X3 [Oryzias latipes]|uniref:ATPase family AAA domain-containing protein 5 isoform X3 n=1 Tax=Oryzias latipes TaxID=8090 RepID=UPI0005CC11E1|nr:ATPase family AAA domain-containing protein 5 isoform X3 [Oryzias latipes]